MNDLNWHRRLIAREACIDELDAEIASLRAQLASARNALEEIEAISDKIVNAHSYTSNDAVEDLSAIRRAIKRVPK